MSDQTALGDRMKSYESKERFLPTLPVVARIDGKCFSKATRKLPRPYCQTMSDTMVQTTCDLVRETGAIIGYTQSDEISLIFHSGTFKSQIFCDGRIQKMNSILASMTTYYFSNNCAALGLELVGPALFDCRVYAVPSREEAVNALVWRELDATKNAISMAAHTYFSHKSLQGVNGDQMQERLFSEKGINFNDYPAFFKRGTYVKRQTVLKELTENELSKIPVDRRPDGLIMRSEVSRLNWPPILKIRNRVGVVFDNEELDVVE